jgi:predicted nucleic acid-binding Zn ribbon protein
MTEEAEMPTHCLVCGALMEGGRDVCEVCQENIRAEAMGRQRRIAKEVHRDAVTVRKREAKGAKTTISPPAPADAEGEKKPHHFKSVAAYLEYLKRKG